LKPAGDNNPRELVPKKITEIAEELQEQPAVRLTGKEQDPAIAQELVRLKRNDTLLLRQVVLDGCQQLVVSVQCTSEGEWLDDVR